MLKKWDPKRGQQEAGIMDQRVTLDFLFFFYFEKSRELWGWVTFDFSNFIKQ